jgi:hypothetical protein
MLITNLTAEFEKSAPKAAKLTRKQLFHKKSQCFAIYLLRNNFFDLCGLIRDQHEKLGQNMFRFRIYVQLIMQEYIVNLVRSHITLGHRQCCSLLSQ